MKTAQFVLTGLLLLSFAGAAVGDDVRTERPSGQAFNRGTYSADVLKKDVAAGLADEINRKNDHADVRHIWIQVFENSRKEATALTTFFVFCTSSFHNTPNRLLDLQSVQAEYVVLDAAGKPAFGETEVITIEWDYDKEKKVEFWKCARKKGRPINEFYATLPEWARAQLDLASGFLKGNPGQPLVDYLPTDTDVALGILEIALFVPGAGNRVAGIVESAIKSVSVKVLKEKIKDKSVRTGADRRITNQRAAEFAADYQKQGRKMWE